MGLNHFGLSREVTGGKPLDTSRIEREKIISQLAGKTHYVDTPEQALDILSKLSEEIGYRDDENFINGVIYILGEFVRKHEDYNINGSDNRGLDPEGVNIVRNRKGVISAQVLEVLQNIKQNPIPLEVMVSKVDLKELSQAITQFLVVENDKENRTKIQAVGGMLQENLNIETLGNSVNWMLIFQEIEKRLSEKKNAKQAA